MSKNVLVVCADLFFSSNLHNGVKQAGHSSKTALSGPQALSLLEQGDYAWVVVDLEMPGVDLRALKEACARQPACRLIAFGPHVQVDLFEKAREAGCDQILSRGQAAGGLARLLQVEG
jgi:CheY-like chemotaxis protein